MAMRMISVAVSHLIVHLGVDPGADSTQICRTSLGAAQGLRRAAPTKWTLGGGRSPGLQNVPVKYARIPLLDVT
jgi:hypothetical protein